MRFSIVTISFNQARYLEETIRSVLDQVYGDLEYIIVDPGSTDGSRDIIEKYREKIDRIIFERDSGAAEGLNHGFAAATGEVFGFLNSDDLLLPGAIQTVARQFLDRPETGIVMGHMRVIDGGGRRLRDSFSDKYCRRALAYGASMACQPSTFFRAELFRKVGGFNETNSASWDAELIADMLERTGQGCLVDSFLSAFRVHCGSMTGAARMRPEKRAFLLANFERIMGRPWRSSDGLVRLFYLTKKYVREPRSLVQRILHGPIAGRFKDRTL